MSRASWLLLIVALVYPPAGWALLVIIAHTDLLAMPLLFTPPLFAVGAVSFALAAKLRGDLISWPSLVAFAWWMTCWGCGFTLVAMLVFVAWASC